MPSLSNSCFPNTLIEVIKKLAPYKQYIIISTNETNFILLASLLSIFYFVLLHDVSILLGITLMLSITTTNNTKSRKTNKTITPTYISDTT